MKESGIQIIEWLQGRLTTQKMKFSIKDYFIFCAMTQLSEVNQMSTKLLEVKR